MIELCVGKPSPFQGMPEGNFFDFDKGGAVLICNFDRPTAEEISNYHQDRPFEARFVRLEGVLFMLFKFGTLPWIDAPYDLRLTKLATWPEPEFGEGYGLTVILQDQKTAIVKELRLIGLGTQFSRDLRAEILSVDATEPLIKPVYDAKISEIYRKYTTNQMVKMSSHYYRIKGAR